MARTRHSEDAEFRLRPRRPRVRPDESKAWSRSFKSLIHLVRMTSRPTHPAADYFGLKGGAPRRNHLQRCAVRVTYSPNRVRGQWAAHGRYISRGSATREAEAKDAGFSATADGIDVPKTLDAWQTAGDQRLFKLIISPEFGERLDLRRHTRELLSRMEHDLGARLEWVAVAHFNTGHPHVHIALRGRTDSGPLRLGRDYIKQGIRSHAENLCTAQLGSGRNWTPWRPSAGRSMRRGSPPWTAALRITRLAQAATALHAGNRFHASDLNFTGPASCSLPPGSEPWRSCGCPRK